MALVPRAYEVNATFGGLQTPTPAEASNGTQVATTAWVRTYVTTTKQASHEAHAWNILGTVRTGISGGLKVILLTGEEFKLVRLDYRIRLGTSVTGELLKNGVLATGFTFTATTVEAHVTPTAVAVANEEKLELNITEVVGGAVGLELTLTAEKLVPL